MCAAQLTTIVTDARLSMTLRITFVPNEVELPSSFCFMNSLPYILLLRRVLLRRRSSMIVDGLFGRAVVIAALNVCGQGSVKGNERIDNKAQQDVLFRVCVGSEHPTSR